MFLLTFLTGVLLAIFWLVNFFQVLAFLTVPLAKWTGLMLIKVIGIPLGYGAFLGFLELLHII